MRNRKRQSGRGGGILRSFGIITIAFGIGFFVAGQLPLESAVSYLQRFDPAPARRQAAPQYEPPAFVGLARPMPICDGGRRISCIVDGDTFWIEGEKVRLQGIDAPEVNGACAYERQLAQKATRRLSEILSDERFALTRSGKDQYDRTLARVETSRGEAGDILVREGLARPWQGRKEQWCT